MKSESLNKLAWKKLRQDKISFFALCYIVLTILIGVFAVVISPDSSPNANEMHIELAAKPPFTQILFLEFPKDEHNETSFFQSSGSMCSFLWKQKQKSECKSKCTFKSKSNANPKKNPDVNRNANLKTN